MPKLQLPINPSGDYCKDCKHFLKSELQRHHVTLTGLVPVPKDFAITHPGETWSDVAPCTQSPHWHTASELHWCGQFVSTITN